jgi:hypothetical protein
MSTADSLVITTRHQLVCPSLVHASPDLEDQPDVQAISMISGERNNGHLNVTFRRKLVTGASPSIDFDLGPSCYSYYLIFVKGPNSFGEHPSPGSTNGPWYCA